MLTHIVSMFCLAFVLAGAATPALALALGGAFTRRYTHAAPAAPATPATPVFAPWGVVLSDIDAAPAAPASCVARPYVARTLDPRCLRGLIATDAADRAPRCVAPPATPATPARSRDLRGRFVRRWQAACRARA